VEEEHLFKKFMSQHVEILLANKNKWRHLL